MLACLAPFFISTSEASHISANLSSASCVSAQFAARATSSLLLLLRLILLLLARDQTSQIDRARAGDITLHGAQPSLPRPFCALWQHRRHLLLLLLLLLLNILLRDVGCVRGHVLWQPLVSNMASLLLQRQLPQLRFQPFFALLLPPPPACGRGSASTAQRRGWSPLLLCVAWHRV